MIEKIYYPNISKAIEEIPSKCRGCSADYDATADKEGYSARCGGCPTLLEELRAPQFEQGAFCA